MKFREELKGIKDTLEFVKSKNPAASGSFLSGSVNLKIGDDIILVYNGFKTQATLNVHHTDDVRDDSGYFLKKPYKTVAKDFHNVSN